ncbi:MAG: Piwi domain-containing protein [Candidatus Bathyarchaeia archaeon]|uniref:Piwi domain-containing protein n=3 Tax=Candidatus Hadarchaeum sp. TaxID=2883567 RepID=UPI003170B841
MGNAILFVEIFPVRIEKIPPLVAYKVNISGGDLATIGGKLSYYLRRKFGQHWVWTSGHILTDAPQNQPEMDALVEKLWENDPDTYRTLLGIYPDEAWSMSPQAQADFVARGLFEDLRPQIQQVLNRCSIRLDKIQIERVYETRGWVIGNHPSVSISVSSRLVYCEDLWGYISRTSSQNLEGLWVADKTSTMKGVITGVSGITGEHRKRLLAITQREEMREIIESASENEPVVRVLAGRNEYEYVASALWIIVRTEHFQRFGINSQDVLNVLRMEPGSRAELVRQISEIGKAYGLIDDAYNSKRTPHYFLTCREIGFDPSLRFGRNEVRKYDEKRVLQNLRKLGVYRKSCNSRIVLGIVSARSISHSAIEEFEKRLIKELERLGFSVEIVGREFIAIDTRAEIERAVARLNAKSPDLLLAFFPDELAEEEDDTDAYHHFKSLTIGQGIPSQVVYESTIDNRYALANIVLGILGKTGSVPFILANKIEYADMIVGIDIARVRKERLVGSINATVMARIYFSDGQFLRYVIHDAPLEGETIPDHVLQSLFPLSEFSGKRVVIHRDGYFRGYEKHALKEWANKIGAEFFLVEVIKTGSPRLYAIASQKIQQPEKGSMFKISDTEALLVSSLPPFTNATPQPLHIRTEAPFTIEKAAHSILCLTLLHYGSLRPPRLPVTIHYSDRIAYLALHGIKPKNLEGEIPFWL